MLRNQKKFFYLLCGICIIFIIIYFIWIFPNWYFEYFYSDQIEIDSKFISNSPNNTIEKLYRENILGKKYESITEIRDQVIKIIAGVIAIIGLYLTFRRTKALEKQNKITQKNNYQTLILNQFSNATELLQSNDIAGRLSGIYLFEKIMNSSIEYHWQIIELLTSYVREKRNISNYLRLDTSELKVFDTIAFYDTDTIFEDGNFARTERIEKRLPKISIEKDIQAIISVLGRRKIGFEKEFLQNNSDTESIKNYIDLSNIYLYKADFSKGNFEWFDFSNSIFNEIICNSTKMNNSLFLKTRIQNSKLKKSEFVKSNCLGSHFEKSLLEYTNFQFSQCNGAYFNFANCNNADFSNAIVSSSHFNNAWLYGAIFHSTICTKTQYRYANCKEAVFNNSKCVQANFTNAYCDSINFENAICQEVHFDEADLSLANFLSCENLTAIMLIKAKSLYGVQNLDPLIEEEISIQNKDIFIKDTNRFQHYHKSLLNNQLKYEEQVRKSMNYEE